MACEYVKKIRADMGGTNLLAPLNWILRQPMQKGHPRLLFLLTDGAIGNTGKVIELLRSHARFTRSINVSSMFVKIVVFVVERCFNWKAIIF